MVPVGALALDRVDDRGLLLGVGQAGAKDLAVAALRAQSGHQPRRGERGLRRCRDLVERISRQRSGPAQRPPLRDEIGVFQVATPNCDS